MNPICIRHLHERTGIPRHIIINLVGISGVQMIDSICVDWSSYTEPPLETRVEDLLKLSSFALMLRLIYLTFREYLFHAMHCSQHFMDMNTFIPNNNIREVHEYSYFLEKGIETQRSETTSRKQAISDSPGGLTLEQRYSKGKCETHM